jgi:putative ABC transport system ATP-binding protein
LIFEFNNVIPNPLKGMSLGAESVWGNSISIDSNKSYLLSSTSGKGKTSFISFIYGSRLDYSGSIAVDGIKWSNISTNDKTVLRKNKISFLPQNIQLFPKLSALDNLKIKNELTKHKSEEELIQLIKDFGLEPQTNQLAGTLSQGQQQRIGIIRAMLQPFEFLILDEPFSHLDKGNIDIAIKIILKACEENKAGFLISTLGPTYGLSTDLIIEL